MHEWTLWPHAGLHFDEVLSLVMLQDFGEHKIPGISNSNIEPIPFGDPRISAKTPEEYWSEGKILVGIGGGFFDEHGAGPGVARIHGETTSSLIAKYLGIDSLPELQNLLPGRHQHYHRSVIPGLAKLINAYNELYDGNTALVISMQAIRNIIRVEKKAWSQELNDSLDSARFWKFVDGSGRVHNCLNCRSASKYMSRFVFRNVYSTHILINRNPETNHVAILSRQNRQIDFSKTVVELRLKEQEVSGKVVETDLETLALEGLVPGIPWYYWKQGQGIFNGSTRPHVIPATVLSDEQIEECVRKGFS